jgi:hypothetical protein
VDSQQQRKSARFLYISDADAPSNWHDRPADATPRIGWRVIAANNRPLGRSADVFRSFEDCVAAAARLHERIETSASSILFDAARGTWAWTVVLDGRAVAVSVKPYRRRIECARALAQFLEALRTTEPVADELRHLGPNALRVYNQATEAPDPVVETRARRPFRSGAPLPAATT